MTEPGDEPAAATETRGPADFRVLLWTNPPIAGQGTRAAQDFTAAHASDVLEWAQAEAGRRSPCLAEVFLKRVAPDGTVETIEIGSFLHGAPFRAPDGQGANGDFSLLAGAGFMPGALWLGAGAGHHHDDFAGAGAADAIVGTPDAVPFGLDGGGYDGAGFGGFDGGGFDGGGFDGGGGGS